MSSDTATPTHFRGHAIRYSEERDGFVYCDTGEPVEDRWESRPCGYCGRDSTPEGHDGCLGTLDGVRNACCGHGETGEAYVQFEDCRELREQEAIDYFQDVTGNPCGSAE
ncbi:MAG: hypothetical protein U5L04_01580 [Trueperaceae bacterium]|nr:hypothetical protein [Trueperaceae bacterium]